MKGFVAESDDRRVDVLGYVNVHEDDEMVLCNQRRLTGGCLVASCPSTEHCGASNPQMGYPGDAQKRALSTLRRRLIDPAMDMTTPTRGTILVIAGHGDGWLGSQFDGQGPELISSTVAAALTGGSMEDGKEHKPLNASVLALFGCHMGQVEALAPLADVADQIVAGQMVIEADSINFARWLKWLRAQPDRSPEEIAVRMARLYHCGADEECESCGSRDVRGAQMMCATSGAGIQGVAAALDSFAATALQLSSDARATLFDHLAGRREMLRSMYSGRAAYSADIAFLFSSPSGDSGLATLVEPSKRIVDAVTNAVRCRSAHPRLAGLGGISALLTCRSAPLRNYKDRCPSSMGHWLEFELGYARPSRCSLGGGEKVRPSIDPHLVDGREIVKARTGRKFRYELVGISPTSIAAVSWTVTRTDGSIVGDGIPVERAHWNASAETGFLVGWEGTVTLLSASGSTIPAPIESEQRVEVSGLPTRYRTVLAHWVPCGDLCGVPVRLLFKLQETGGAEQFGVLADAQVASEACQDSSWGSTIELADGCLEIDPAPGSLAAITPACPLNIGPSTRVQLNRTPLEPGDYEFSTTVRLGGGAIIRSAPRKVRVVDP